MKGAASKLSIDAGGLNHGWTRINTDFLTEANEGNKGDTGFANLREFFSGTFQVGFFMGLTELKRDDPGQTVTIRDSEWVGGPACRCRKSRAPQRRT